MRIKKENRKEMEQLPLDPPKKKEKVDRKKKLERDEGPKWVSAALLLVTVWLSLYFWVRGTGGLGEMTEKISDWMKNWRSEKVYIIE